MINTEVGQRCPTCGRGRPALPLAPSLLLRGGAAGLVTASLIGLLWSLAPGFAFWIGLLMGAAVGEVVARGLNRRRGWLAMILAAASVLLGFLIGYFLLRGRGAQLLPILINPLLLLTLVGPFGLIALVIAIVLAALRQRG
jgi:hypothetical protein